MLKDFKTHVIPDLDAYINGHPSITATVKTDIANIGDYGTALFPDNNQSNIFISLVKIEEESALRNFPNQKTSSSNGTDILADKRFPKIHLNYYLLFSATLSYDMSVAAIHRIIKFFQSHKRFQFSSDQSNLDLTLELVSQTFEQINHMWGTLGGKQFPHVLYKARVSEFEYDEPQMKSTIKTITTTLE